ncbi:MAG: ATP-binding protein [Microvirga sp.]
MALSRPRLWFRRSLPAKLAVAAAIFVSTVASVHVLSLDRLTRLGTASSEVRNRWLDSTQFIQRLSEPVSDLRALEADSLLINDPGQRERRLASIPDLISQAAEAKDRYGALRRDVDEERVFEGFSNSWAEHVGHAQQLASLMRTGARGEALSLFDGAARTSFSNATDKLRELADLTESKAKSARDIASQATTAAQLWISSLIFSIFVLFLSLAAYLWWSVSRPLFELADLMRPLAGHHTTFSIRFAERPDEIGEMARALAVFKSNTIELLESRKRLASQTEVLARTLDKERALATEHRNFIGTMSHEFRTPLTAIDGHAQRLITNSRRANPSEVAERAQKIRSAVFRMTSLVGGLLNAADLVHGDLRKSARRPNLKEMLLNLARYYDEIGIGRGLEARIGDLPKEMSGDPELLYQAFSNLISNAFKYSPEDGIVTMTAVARESFVEVTIEDCGRGVPRDEISRICEPYYRASNAGSVPGTGMGLHLVSEIVRRHGGRLEIESEEGRGTKMIVILPVEEPSEPSERKYQ